MASPTDKGAQSTPSPAELKAPKPRFRPNEDEDRNAVEGHAPDGGIGQEPRGIQKDIADAEKARTGGAVRNTPPAGDWNDTTK
jgi:hypothetical protein